MVIVNGRSSQPFPPRSATRSRPPPVREERGWETAARETVARTQVLRENRMTVVEPAPALRDGLLAIGRQIAGEWEAAAGADGRAILEAFRRA